MYRNGEGVPQNDKTAVKWYRLAVEQGLAGAQTLVEELQKKIADQNELQARAKQGDAPAQFSLGFMYDTGKGVPQNDKTAVKWYKLAAEQGDATAQTNLGIKYFIGKGVVQDYVRTHMWLSIAASQGYKDASKKREVVAKQMTTSQIETAQKLARECVNKNYKGC